MGWSRAIDLVGQKFGTRTVIERGPNTKFGAAQWWVESDLPCKCRTLVPMGELKGGRRDGCKHHHAILVTKPMAVGEKFNHWTVLKRVDRPGGLVNRSAYYLCVCDCPEKVERVVGAGNLRSGTTKSCGHTRKDVVVPVGPAHFNWKGGWINAHGYRVFQIDGEQIYEHRYVMEQALGRKLSPDEDVHHRNGERTDNRLENLELKKRYHGSGQSIEDVVVDAVAKLRRYKPEALAETAKDEDAEPLITEVESVK